jgi:hypothetical protein
MRCEGRPRREFGGERTARELSGQETAEGDLAEANAALAEEMTSGDVQAVLLKGVHF